MREALFSSIWLLFRKDSFY